MLNQAPAKQIVQLRIVCQHSRENTCLFLGGIKEKKETEDGLRRGGGNREFGVLICVCGACTETGADLGSGIGLRNVSCCISPLHAPNTPQIL